MIPAFSSIITLLISVTLVQTQPVPSCLDDSQCHENYICELRVYVCRKCLDCKEFNRSSLPRPVQSDADCGPCLQGLVL